MDMGTVTAKGWLSDLETAVIAAVAGGMFTKDGAEA